MASSLRWGILGTGRIAHTFARDMVFAQHGVVVAVGSRSQDSADAFGREFDLDRCHDSYEALVADAHVDAVYIATPHPMHRSNALAALEFGKPVLVEKCFTMDAAEAREVASAAQSRGLFAMEAMWTRFLPHVVAIRTLLAEGALGEVVSLEADHGQWFEPDPTSRLFAPELGGSALLDLGVYPVSFASMVLGTPERVVAMVKPAFSGVDALTSMLFGYANGTQAVLSCTSSARTATRAAISGTSARIEIEGDFYAPTSFTLVSREGSRNRFDFATVGRGLHYQVDEVARCIAEGLTESPVMPLDETVSIMATMDRVRSFL